MTICPLPVIRHAIGALLLAAAAPAIGGPPYQTDDPEPTDFGHWEIYAFATADGRHGDVDGSAGIDLNYGGARGLQLTMTLPVAFNRSTGGSWGDGAGDAEVAAKYRFLMTSSTVGRQRSSARFLPTSSNGLGERARACCCSYGRKGLREHVGVRWWRVRDQSRHREQDFWQGLAVTHDSTTFVGTEVSGNGGHARAMAHWYQSGTDPELGGPCSLFLPAGQIFGRQTSYHSYGAFLTLSSLSV